ncbi:MAG: RNB domain-containing ribonuclease, partial [Propionicimonas sp.]|uniref:RNB domain-containing ribonuclease n=1 Tax=Propionicimonas sp. TaxID=1955623 RepID=UPI003D0F1A5B
MPSRYVSLQTSEPPALREGLRRLRATLGVPGQFSSEVLAEAAHAAANPVLPTADRTDVEFVTLDPEGSNDLDQAFHLARTATGFQLLYAIADVAAFVSPGGHIDTEAHARAETLYAPTRKTPLHPSVLSEGAASLLPDEVRPALVWELEFDADGQTTSTRVARGLVRSRDKLSYTGAQAALDAGTGGEQLELLRTLGTLRLEL